MASLGSMWAPVAIRVLRQAVGSTAKISKVLRTKLGNAARPLNSQLQPQTASAGARQPLHHFAFLRQQKRVRWHSTLRGPHDAVRSALRRFLNGPSAARSSGRPAGQTARAVFNLTGRAPFATSLRPNLTGGALPRTAGGYAMPGAGGRIGGARHFSHAPASQAQVVQNVGQAMRAFWLSGQRARFDGCGADGQKRYRAVTALQDDAARKVAAASVAARRVPGSFVDFSVNPTITALSPLAAAFPFAMCGAERDGSFAAAAGPTLNEDGLLDLLSMDFERTLKDLAAVMSDLKRLAGLGDLPVLLEKNQAIRVRFPGVDAETVSRLCDDLGVQRGVVGQDDDFDEEPDVAMALRFPFAPDKHSSVALSSPGGSLRSHQSELSSDLDDAFVDQFLEENPWLSSAHSVEEEEEGYFTEASPSSIGLSPNQPSRHAEDFEGVQGIYRFIQECDRATGRA